MTWYVTPRNPEVTLHRRMESGRFLEVPLDPMPEFWYVDDDGEVIARPEHELDWEAMSVDEWEHWETDDCRCPPCHNPYRDADGNRVSLGREF